jgi:hypothetical protein
MFHDSIIILPMQHKYLLANSNEVIDIEMVIIFSFKNKHSRLILASNLLSTLTTKKEFEMQISQCLKYLELK